MRPIFSKILFTFFAVVFGLCFLPMISLAAGVSAVAGNGSATVSFTPGTNGSSATSNYTVTASPGGQTATGTTSPITISGLTNGTQYTFTVTATNSSGTSSPSDASNAVTPSATAGGGTTGTDSGTGVGVSYPNGNGTNAIQSGSSYSYTQYVEDLYGFSMKAAIALCTLMVIYAGYKYMTSRGDSSAINEAKDILVSTLMGAALLMLVVFVGYISGLTVNINPSTTTTPSTSSTTTP